ncbi:uncharacterized protein LOC141633075 isoform X2 [Silene latifolia]
MKTVVTYEGYVINGFRFHTKRRQRSRKTQNSGVIVKGDVESGEKDFYGVLDEVIILEYGALKNRTSPSIVLFKCRWFDVYDEGRRIRKDKFGAVLVNVTRMLKTNEPFALASQIEQVFYVAAHNQPQWRYVIKTNPRNYFDFPNDEDIEVNESLWNHVAVETLNHRDNDVLELVDSEISLVRNDVEANLVVAEDITGDGFIIDDEVEEDEEEDEELSDMDSDSSSSLPELDDSLEDANYKSDSSEE